MHHLSKTLHVLCIMTNARYGENSPQPDMDDFFKTLKTIQSKTPDVSPLGLSSGFSYLDDYICAMYPEFKQPVEYFSSLVSPTQRDKGQQLTQAAIAQCFDQTMTRFPNLKPYYDFEQNPSPKQMARLMKTVGAKQKQDMEQNAPQALAQMGIALLDKSHDIHLVHQFMDQFRTIEHVACGEVDRETARQHMDISGVVLGLKMAEMKEQGILDEHLNILDKDRFYKSDFVKCFTIGGKRFDLTPPKQFPSFMGRLINHIKKQL